MKNEIKTGNNICFHHISVGDGFVFNGNTFIKIYPLKRFNYSINSYVDVNAICLETGSSCCFDDSEIVTGIKNCRVLGEV